jgi:hypothetical protein
MGPKFSLSLRLYSVMNLLELTVIAQSSTWTARMRTSWWMRAYNTLGSALLTQNPNPSSMRWSVVTIYVLLEPV